MKTVNEANKKKNTAVETANKTSKESGTDRKTANKTSKESGTDKKTANKANKKSDNPMKTVHEVSKLTGVSVRTLHHYDAIGLLKPSKVSEAGYRLYDDTALARLQHILLFRELKFPLKKIRQILDAPDFDPQEALAGQIALLKLEWQHLGELIRFAQNIQKKGVISMEFQVFDRTEIEAYKEEAAKKWGNTPEYKEFSEKHAKDPDAEKNAQEIMALFAELGKLKTLPPSHPSIQEIIGNLQQLISKHYYRCDNKTLSGLGQMYVQDERFRHNIDRAGGEGCAAFAAEAIAVFCAAD